MNLNNLLLKKEIAFKPTGDYLAISCPFCDSSRSGRPVLTLNLEIETGDGYCSICTTKFKWKDIAEELGIDPKALFAETEPLKNNLDNSKNTEENYKYKEPTLMSVKNIFLTNFGEQKWLIESLIPLESPIVISGSSGNYKSWLTQDIARCVALGIDFLGNFRVIQGSVLIVDMENHLRIVQERLKKLQVPKNAPIYYFDTDNFKIDNSKHLNQLLSVITTHNIKLVIFDSLIRMHSGDENESKQISKILEHFKKIIKLGANVILIHHLRKENGFQKSSINSIRGSSDISAFVDVAFIVKKGKEKGYFTVENPKLRQAVEHEPFTVEIIEDEESISFKYAGISNSLQEQVKEVQEAIVEILEENKIASNSDLNTALKDIYKKSIITMALKELETSGIIIKDKMAHNKFSFSLKVPA